MLIYAYIKASVYFLKIKTSKKCNVFIYIQIIKEMLRLVSMNFASFREAKRDVTINGLWLFNVNIYISIYYCHCWTLKKNKTFISSIFLGYIIPKGWKVLPWLRAIYSHGSYILSKLG